VDRQLGLAIREDGARNGEDDGPATIAVLRRALDVVRTDISKGSMAKKLERADGTTNSC